MITETEEVSAALDAGQRRWPELSRGKVAARLLEEIGRERVAEDERAALAARRRRRLRRPDAAVAAWFPVGAHERLREDWPD